jgi:hypothetical protein
MPRGGWLQGALGGATAIKATAAVVAILARSPWPARPSGTSRMTPSFPGQHHVPAVAGGGRGHPGPSGVPTATTPQARARCVIDLNRAAPEAAEPGQPCGGARPSLRF